MGMVQEFKEFASKGNVVDLAVGVIIGGAFGKIVSSAVADVLMPPLGLLLGGVNFTALKARLGGTDAAPVTLNYGNFLQACFDFLVVAFCIFLLVKAVNAMKRKEEAAPAAPPAPSPEQLLLGEIRDILKSPRG